MKQTYLTLSLAVTAALVLTLPAAASAQSETSSTYENENGNVVQTEVSEKEGPAGFRVRNRQFDIAEPSGERVATGKDRDWASADGGSGSSQTAIRRDAEGNRVLKRRQEHENADGDQRSRNGKSVRDADGNLIAKGINGEATKDGTTYKTQTRSRSNADGDVVTATRRAKVDANGKKTVVKKPRTTSSKTGGTGRGGKTRRQRN